MNMNMTKKENLKRIETLAEDFHLAMFNLRCIDISGDWYLDSLRLSI